MSERVKTACLQVAGPPEATALISRLRADAKRLNLVVSARCDARGKNVYVTASEAALAQLLKRVHEG